MSTTEIHVSYDEERYSLTPISGKSMGMRSYEYLGKGDKIMADGYSDVEYETHIYNVDVTSSSYGGKCYIDDRRDTSYSTLPMPCPKMRIPNIVVASPSSYHLQYRSPFPYSHSLAGVSEEELEDSVKVMSYSYVDLQLSESSNHRIIDAMIRVHGKNAFNNVSTLKVSSVSEWDKIRSCGVNSLRYLKINGVNKGDVIHLNKNIVSLELRYISYDTKIDTLLGDTKVDTIICHEVNHNRHTNDLLNKCEHLILLDNRSEVNIRGKQVNLSPYKIDLGSIDIAEEKIVTLRISKARDGLVRHSHNFVYSIKPKQEDSTNI